MDRYIRYLSPLGTLTLVSADGALTELRLDGTVPEGASAGQDRALAAACAWLDRYFRGEDWKLDVPLAPKGTAFQQRVWSILARIPWGSARSYGDIAREIVAATGAEKMSAQAVGGAVGRNPIPILIPCHRVVGADGGLTGYTGGLEIKRWLLRHEGWLKD